MNERLEQLYLEAATDTIDPNGPFTPEEIIKFKDKFAELIVRDCITIIEGYCETSPEIYGLPLEIMDHFGIDEIE